MTDDKVEQLADQVIRGAQVFIDKKLEAIVKALKLSDRLAAIEAASGTSESMKSLERRASRAGDHLQNLERRVKLLEHGSPPAPQLLEDRSHDRQ